MKASCNDSIATSKSDKVCSSCDSFFQRQNIKQNVPYKPVKATPPSSKAVLTSNDRIKENLRGKPLPTPILPTDLWKKSFFISKSTNLQSFQKLLPPFRIRKEPLHCQWRDGENRCQQYFGNAEALARHVNYNHIEEKADDDISIRSQASSSGSKTCRWSTCSKSTMDLPGHVVKRHLSRCGFACPFKYCPKQTTFPEPITMKELEEHVRVDHPMGNNFLPSSIPVLQNSEKQKPPAPLPTGVPMYLTDLKLLRVDKKKNKVKSVPKVSKIRKGSSFFDKANAKYPEYMSFKSNERKKKERSNDSDIEQFSFAKIGSKNEKRKRTSKGTTTKAETHVSDEETTETKSSLVSLSSKPPPQKKRKPSAPFF